LKIFGKKGVGEVYGDGVIEKANNVYPELEIIYRILKEFSASKVYLYTILIPT